MGWQIWLAAPMLVTFSAAVLIWWQARPKGTPSVHARVREHNRFLDQLARQTGPAPGLPESVIVDSGAVDSGAVDSGAGAPDGSGEPPSESSPS